MDRRIYRVVIILLGGAGDRQETCAPRSLVGDKPNAGVLFWAVHIFNFLCLLVANPVAAVLLIVPGKRAIAAGSLLAALCAAGAVAVAAGYIFLAWALMTLRRNYQAGGNPPCGSDDLVVGGPYRLAQQ